MPRKSKTSSHRFVILGAGLAGLSAAIHLREAGFDPIIIEKEKVAGGLFTNSTVAGCDFDFGPKILLLDESENSKHIKKYLGNDFDKLPVVEKVYLKDHGQLHFPLQRHLIDFPQELRDEIIEDIKQTQTANLPYGNFKEWLISKYGKKFCEMILIPYEEKKWQAKLEDMDYRWALKRPVRVNLDEVLAGSQTLLPPNKFYYYPKKGNISTFTNRLITAAGNILLERAVTGIDMDRKIVKTTKGFVEYDTLISTIPLDQFASNTPKLPTYLNKGTDKYLKRLSIYVVNLVFKGNFDLQGTAIYFPEDEYIFRRISVLENLCPALKRQGKTPLSVEVSINPRKGMTEKQIYTRILKDLAKIPQFAQLGKPFAHEIRLVDFAYPLQLQGHSYHVGELHRFFAQHDIYHCGRGGNYDYCNGDVAFHQGQLTAKRAIGNLELSAVSKPELSITVGIPSYNSGQSIIHTVKSILASKTKRKINIIVSVDGPTMTKNIEQQLKKFGVKIIHNDERQGQTARNAQIANVAKTDLVIMTQDDVVFDRHAIQHIITAFTQDKQLTMIAPHIAPLESQKFFEDIVLSGAEIARSVAKQWHNGDNYLSSIGRCLAYRTEMVQQFDIDDNIINCDAFYYFENKRLGGKFQYIETAKVFYRLPQTLHDHLKQVRKFVVSKQEMSNYIKSDLNAEYTLPPTTFLKAVSTQLIKKPIQTSLYVAVSVFARTRPRSFYQEVTRFWEVDKSTKNT